MNSAQVVTTWVCIGCVWLNLVAEVFYWRKRRRRYDRWANELRAWQAAIETHTRAYGKMLDAAAERWPEAEDLVTFRDYYKREFLSGGMH